MIFWLFCAFIWFTNIEKMLLQMTSGFLQLESTINELKSRKLNPKMIQLSKVKLNDKKEFQSP
jgi:hypothetical protein